MMLWLNYDVSWRFNDMETFVISCEENPLVRKIHWSPVDSLQIQKKIKKTQVMCDALYVVNQKELMNKQLSFCFLDTMMLI